MLWYLVFCLALFAVMVSVEYFREGELNIDNIIIDFPLALVPGVNFYIAFKLICEGVEYVFCKAVDSLWFSKIWNED